MSHYPKLDFDNENPTAPSSSSSSKKWSITPLGARILTLVSLIVSIVIMKTNNISFKDGGLELTVDYNYVHTYRYAVFSMVAGFAYTLVQIPFAIYYLKTGKRLINHRLFSYLEFYGDKLSAFLLATAVGAVFGVTSELKRGADRLQGDDQSKYDNFLNLGYISGGFLLIAFVGSAVTAIKSSLALS
ncbi:hypothetical protein LguiA_031480 [Lonicera macranthoides]